MLKDAVFFGDAAQRFEPPLANFRSGASVFEIAPRRLDESLIR